MKIISWNINGIRAVEKKGELQKFLQNEDPDLLFVQEIKAKKEQLSNYLTENSEYLQFYHSAEKPGYSGVGAWVKKSWIKKKNLSQLPVVETGMPGWNDSEGRVICLEFAKFTAIGVYFPNGGKSEAAWLEKLEFYEHFLGYVNDLRKTDKTVIWCGDLNVAHNPIDLARPKENEGSIGFRPEERAWVDKVVDAHWVDVFRTLYPNKESYTWWHMISNARARNVGWRIDYFFVDQADFAKVKSAPHINSQMGSDHCPLALEIDI
ncbi:MAG: exodeoxyribonuclease III [Spirochaetia bacterium]|nr:exodeoxyribonuclease III [Spirochaetia bacterium]